MKCSSPDTDVCELKNGTMNYDNAFNPGSTNDFKAFAAGSLILLEATDGVNGYELWTLDPSSGDTTMVTSGASTTLDFQVSGLD